MAARLDSSLSCLCFLAYASYSSSVMATCLSRTSLRPYVTQTIRLLSHSRTSLRPVVSSLVYLPDWTISLSLTFTALRLFVLVSPLTCIYTGLEMGRSPSSIYFATTLVL